MIKIKVLTLKRRKVRDSHLAGRDLSIGKKFCTILPPRPPPQKKRKKMKLYSILLTLRLRDLLT